MFTRVDYFKIHRDQRVYHAQVDIDWGYHIIGIHCVQSHNY
jgi:hypothetical protein